MNFFSLKHKNQFKNIEVEKLEKLKPMLPSLREKKRYVVFEIISHSRIESFKAINDAVWNACLSFFGELGASKAGIMLLEDKWSQKKQRFLVRVNRKYVDHLKVALALVKKINNEKALIRSVGASGMIQKAEAKYL